jgi:hypothetical protein
MLRAPIITPNVEQRLSREELDSLRRLKRGANAALIPSAHRDRFVRLGWAEMKYGGYVLTTYGRYQLDLRQRESGLSLLARRWRNRAEELRTIADDMTLGDANTLHAIASEWDALADQLLVVEKAEQSEPLLG